MTDSSLAEAPIIPATRPVSVAHGSGEERRRIADAIGAACRNIGFFVITGHGVPAELIERVSRISRDFYDLPVGEKLKSSSPRRGYFGTGRQAVAPSMDGE